MYEILKKEELSPNVYAMEIDAPRVAKKAEPGQFIILRVNEEGERIPLTIADFNRETGRILIVFQVIGASTMKLAAHGGGGQPARLRRAAWPSVGDPEARRHDGRRGRRNWRCADVSDCARDA